MWVVWVLGEVWGWGEVVGKEVEEFGGDFSKRKYKINFLRVINLLL